MVRSTKGEVKKRSTSVEGKTCSDDRKPKVYILQRTRSFACLQISARVHRHVFFFARGNGKSSGKMSNKDSWLSAYIDIDIDEKVPEPQCFVIYLRDLHSYVACRKQREREITATTTTMRLKHFDKRTKLGCRVKNRGDRRTKMKSHRFRWRRSESKK